MALYYPPVKPNAPIYSYGNFAIPNTPISPGQGGSSVTEEWLASHYLQFPNAQGVENFGFQELNFTNSNAGESATLYLNPSASEDMTLLSNQNGGGLTVRNPSASFTLNPFPIASGLVGCQTSNPIDMNGQGLYGLNNLYADGNDTSSSITMTTTGTTISGILSTNTIGGISGANPSLSVSPANGDDSTKIATTAFVLANQGTPTDLSNYAQKTYAPLQTFTGPIDVNETLSCNDLTISSTNGTSSLAYYTPNNLSLAIGNTDTFYIQTIGGTNLMTLNTTEIDALKTFNMNAQNIIGIGALAGNGGNISCNSNLLIGTGNNLNLQNNNIINCNSITDTSGQYTTTNTPPDNSITTAIATTGYVANAIANIPPASGFAVLNQGGIQNWLGNNTCSNGIWDYTTNSTVLVQTVANSTNNNTSASTAFVKANAGVFTQTSMTMDSSIYWSMTPSTVNVITTYTSANNVVSFNSVQFVITIGTVPTFLLASMTFSAPPFPGAPPSNTLQYISMYCSNGATYTGQINWSSSTNFRIGINGGPSLISGMTFTCNLANLGAFTP